MALITLGILASSAGCDPLGSVDCLAAIDAAGVKLTGSGGVLYFGAGTYKVSAAITWPANVGIEIGQGVTFTGAGAASVTTIATGSPASPGAAGQFLKSNGPGALPTWAAAGGGMISPVSIMIASDALAGLGYAGDTLTSTNSALTVGVGFIANEAGHTCTGVRFWWNPVIAGTVTATLWAMEIGGGGTSVGTVTGAASGDTTLSFAPVTLVKGATYVVSVYDGAHYCHIGTVAGGTSFVNTQLGTPTLWANSWLQYVQHANNGGGGTSTPFSAYVNAPNAFPVNQGGQFMPIEPVLT